jgi:hypothetical protein
LAIVKPTPGATGWHTATDAVIDFVNALSPSTAVPISADNVTDGSTNKAFTAAEKTKLAGLSQGIAPTLVDAKGDLIAASAADTVVRVPIGTAGQVLTVDLDAPSGLAWESPDVTAPVFTINAQTGTAYTLVLGDFTTPTFVRMSNASANNLTVPPNSSVAVPVGGSVVLHQYGVGQTTVLPGSGVTIRSFLSAMKLAGQYATATLLKLATNEWLLSGDITT